MEPTSRRESDELFALSGLSLWLCTSIWRRSVTLSRWCGAEQREPPEPIWHSPRIESERTRHEYGTRVFDFAFGHDL